MSAQAAAKRPSMPAAAAVSPPSSRTTSGAKTGATMPNASMSRSTVTKMNANAARLTPSHYRRMARRVAVDEIAAHNERMWDRLARAGIPYTRPQGSPPRDRAGKRRFLDEITRGRFGDISFDGKRVLALAGGGGWDAILFAELGADTTLFDISARQLATVRALARRRGTEIDYVRGDMRDLGALGSGEFDLVFHQHSLVFVPDAPRVIREVARVLALGGTYVFSTMHPATFLFYESWTGKGWTPKQSYFSDRPVPVKQPVWEFGRVRVVAPTYEYAHRTGDLVNACAVAGLFVDGLWEWAARNVTRMRGGGSCSGRFMGPPRGVFGGRGPPDWGRSPPERWCQDASRERPRHRAGTRAPRRSGWRATTASAAERRAARRRRSDRRARRPRRPRLPRRARQRSSPARSRQSS